MTKDEPKVGQKVLVNAIYLGRRNASDLSTISVADETVVVHRAEIVVRSENEPYIIRAGDFDPSTQERQSYWSDDVWVSDEQMNAASTKLIVVRDKATVYQTLYTGLYQDTDGSPHNFGNFQRGWVPGFSRSECLGVYEYRDGELRRLSDDQVSTLREESER